MTPAQRDLIATAYEVEANLLRKIPARNPFRWFFFRAMSAYFDTRAKAIRAGA